MSLQQQYAMFQQRSLAWTIWILLGANLLSGGIGYTIGRWGG